MSDKREDALEVAKRILRERKGQSGETPEASPETKPTQAGKDAPKTNQGKLPPPPRNLFKKA